MKTLTEETQVLQHLTHVRNPLKHALSANVTVTAALCGDDVGTGGKNERHLSCRVTHILVAVARIEQHRIPLRPPTPFPLHQHSNVLVQPALEKPGSQIFRSTALTLKPRHTNTRELNRNDAE